MERYNKATLPFCAMVTLIIISVLAANDLPASVKVAWVIFGTLSLAGCLVVTSLWPGNKTAGE